MDTNKLILTIVIVIAVCFAGYLLMVKYLFDKVGDAAAEIVKSSGSNDGATKDNVKESIDKAIELQNKMMDKASEELDKK